MSEMLRRTRAIVLALGLGCAGAAAAQLAPHSPPPIEAAENAPFAAENTAAMHKMMEAMTVMPSGDIDRDFTAMMIPHHQGAIDMAVAYLRHGTNEQLRRIAQEIIVEQQQEIAAMHLALGQPLPPSAAAQTQIGAGQPSGRPSHEHSSMPDGAIPSSSSKATR
jgi:Domain of unknown function (DUF305)